MKSLLILAVTLGAVACAQFPPFQGFQQAKQFQASPFAFASTAKPYYPAPPAYKPVARSGGPEAAAQTLRSGNDISPDGSFNYFFDTENGIAAQAEGTPKQFPGNPPLTPDVFRGSFSWTAPDGQPISITYVADENGYQPSGAAIPTPHPIPEAILRSIEYNARNAKA